MTDQQGLGLLLAAALVFIPAGMLLGTLVRLVRWTWTRLLPPRYLRQTGVRRRRPG